ncbi:UNVERIFIED_CONTAM: flagellar protein FliT [Halobacillus marinus]
MCVWEQFLTVTKELKHTVEQPVTDQNRAGIIADIQKLLAKRDDLLPHLPQPSQSEQELVRAVGNHDLVINQKMEFLFEGLKRDMRNMKKQKKSKQSYTNPYQSISGYDGMYLDHKK